MIDGGYRRKIGDLVLARADTVVWLDLPDARLATAARPPDGAADPRADETLWNDNKETLRTAFWGRDSLFGYALRIALRPAAALPAVELAAYPVIRLRTQAEIDRFVRDAGAT